ncbi:hypothetical protein BT63DRAFT_451193 [Microthyrium microscopicum]|uniref:Uncharacterized protein n=1 Tax=Microthyrium microscopicum TaxID=703497 RepID=A0A6A6ULP8_9PEZI|nr:hypothetical protein BT63DRAFT_451193 [Microthyrium microscopicum]
MPPPTSYGESHLQPRSDSVNHGSPSPWYDPSKPPIPASIFSLVLNIVSIMTLTYCLHVRWPAFKTAKQLPYISWVNVVLYVDSLLFTTAQMITNYAFGLNYSFRACQAAVMFCLSFYLSSKLLIYFYFTERSFLVWSDRSAKRLRNPMYIFNMTGIIGGYIVIVVFTFVFRINHLSLSGLCVIGLERRISIPLVSYEMVINAYLTFLFLWPLRKVYSYSSRKSSNSRLRRMAMRCMIGTSITCVSTGANLIVLTCLDGEEAWLCLMLCNVDIIICVVTLHWVTSFGQGNKSPTIGSEIRPASPPHTEPKKRIARPDRRPHVPIASWVDHTVTTSISHAQVTSPPGSPMNSIMVHMEQSQKIEPCNNAIGVNSIGEGSIVGCGSSHTLAENKLTDSDTKETGSSPSPGTEAEGRSQRTPNAMSRQHLIELGLLRQTPDSPFVGERNALSRSGSIIGRPKSKGTER